MRNISPIYSLLGDVRDGHIPIFGAHCLHVPLNPFARCHRWTQIYDYAGCKPKSLKYHGQKLNKKIVGKIDFWNWFSEHFEFNRKYF